MITKYLEIFSLLLSCLTSSRSLSVLVSLHKIVAKHILYFSHDHGFKRCTPHDAIQYFPHPKLTLSNQWFHMKISLHNPNDTLKQYCSLPNFTKTFHSLINLSLLSPGWTKSTLVPTAYYVSAEDLENPCRHNLEEALNASNPDAHIWQLSYE